MGMSFSFQSCMQLVLTYISAKEQCEWCAICKHPVDSVNQSTSSTLGDKGSQAVNKASSSRKDSIHTVPGEKVHRDRRTYCKPDQIAKDTKQEESNPCTSSGRHALRSSEEGFSFTTDCLFCGRPAKFVWKRKKYDVLQVKTMTLSWQYAANELIVGQMSKHALCMCMTCMRQMQFTTRLAVLISAQGNRCQWLSW
jgi:hypothetical protein